MRSIGGGSVLRRWAGGDVARVWGSRAHDGRACALQWGNLSVRASRRSCSEAAGAWNGSEDSERTSESLRGRRILRARFEALRMLRLTETSRKLRDSSGEALQPPTLTELSGAFIRALKSALPAARKSAKSLGLAPGQGTSQRVTLAVAVDGTAPSVALAHIAHTIIATSELSATVRVLALVVTNRQYDDSRVANVEASARDPDVPNEELLKHMAPHYSKDDLVRDSDWSSDLAAVLQLAGIAATYSARDPMTNALVVSSAVGSAIEHGAFILAIPTTSDLATVTCARSAVCSPMSPCTAFERVVDAADFADGDGTALTLLPREMVTILQPLLNQSAAKCEVYCDCLKLPYREAFGPVSELGRALRVGGKLALREYADAMPASKWRAVHRMLSKLRSEFREAQHMVLDNSVVALSDMGTALIDRAALSGSCGGSLGDVVRSVQLGAFRRLVRFIGQSHLKDSEKLPQSERFMRRYVDGIDALNAARELARANALNSSNLAGPLSRKARDDFRSGSRTYRTLLNIPVLPQSVKTAEVSESGFGCLFAGVTRKATAEWASQLHRNRNLPGYYLNKTRVTYREGDYYEAIMGAPYGLVSISRAPDHRCYDDLLKEFYPGQLVYFDSRFVVGVFDEVAPGSLPPVSPFDVIRCAYETALRRDEQHAEVELFSIYQTRPGALREILADTVPRRPEEEYFQVPQFACDNPADKNLENSAEKPVFGVRLMRHKRDIPIVYNEAQRIRFAIDHISEQERQAMPVIDIKLTEQQFRELRENRSQCLETERKLRAAEVLDDADDWAGFQVLNQRTQVMPLRKRPLELASVPLLGVHPYNKTAKRRFEFKVWYLPLHRNILPSGMAPVYTPGVASRPGDTVTSRRSSAQVAARGARKRAQI